jgi:hydroxyethylthiazole kinase
MSITFDIKSASSLDYAHSCAAMLDTIAQSQPRVQCITNSVAMDFSSDVLLAVGARISLTLGREEIQEFVAKCDSLSVNIGTLNIDRKAAIEPALETALYHHRPWVLDPVSVHISKTRCQYARTLLEYNPSVIRGNTAEIKALAGIDSPEAPWVLAQQTGAIIAQTGQSDIITDGKKALMIANGHLMQTCVTAMGCAATAFIATFLAVNRRPFDATVQALLAFSIAGELAVKKSQGPGSLHTHILDTLYHLDKKTLERHAHILSCSEVS